VISVELRVARDVSALLKRIHINPWYFALPVSLSVSVAVLEGVGMGLLIPLLNGFLMRDFSFVVTLPVIGNLTQFFPSTVELTDRTLFALLTGLFMLVIVLKNLLRLGAALGMGYLSTRSVHHLRKHLFHAYLSFGKRYFDRSPIGHHATVLMKFAAEALWPLMFIDRYLNALLSLLAYLIVLLLISWKLTLVALPLFLLLHFVVRSTIRRIQSLSHSIAAIMRSLGKAVTEILSVLPLVHAYNTEEEERRRYAAISDETARLEFRRIFAQQLIRPMQEIITLLAVVGLFASMVYLLVRTQSATAPSLLVYFYVILNMTTKFTGLTAAKGEIVSSAGALAAVTEVFSPTGKEHVPDGRSTFPGLRKAVTLRRLTFAYNEGIPVLRNVTFEVEKGSVTALVGPTGAGKSTIVHLLLRFYDCPPDSILLDGEDIRTFSVASLREHMAFVSQETLLFHDSLRANLVYGSSGRDDRRLWDVLERARLATFVRSLPMGLDTPVGDRGVQLSGGEKQRLSIARALLRNADILLLDEATSALDAETERLVQEAIRDAIVGKTTLVIAHRLSTIRGADRIVVLDEGCCREQGTFDELITMQGVFYRSWQEQKF
jgi:subfamily B ATP-binding cassette protein MsbA